MKKNNQTEPADNRNNKEQNQKQKFGELLTEQGLLTDDDLLNSLQEQSGNRSKRIGDILVENKAVSRETLETTLKKAAKKFHGSTRSRVGEILIDAGIVSEESLKNALISLEKGRKERIGSLLIKQGVISETQLLSALALKLKLRCIDLEKTPPSPEAIASISKQFALRLQVIPVAITGKTLVVATAEINDPFMEEYLSFNTGLNIEMVLATQQQIRDALEKFFEENGSEVEAILDRMADYVDVVDDEVDVDQFNESDSAVIKFVNKVLLASVKEKASDIHFEPGMGRADLEIRFRIDGECRLSYKVPSSYKKAVISRLKILANLNIAERRQPQSGKIMLKSGNQRLEYRIEITPTAGEQEDAVLRVMASARPLPLEMMGFSPENLDRFKSLLHKPYGIILCVGPTGSGKTTTLHSAMGHINTPNRKIWTAEEPVEITQPGLRQVQVNHAIGLTFSNALRSFLRADPDVIMVGEMRDPETAKMAVEASLTGHLVFSTLHTNSAVETVNRLLQIGIEPVHFADALLGIVAQRLVLKLCENCKESYHPEIKEYEKLVHDYGAELFQSDSLPLYSKTFTLMRKRGCVKCNGTGYVERIGIYELLIGTEEIKQAIVDRESIPEIRRRAIEGGMRSLRMDGIQRVFQGITDYEHILKVCI